MGEKPFVIHVAKLRRRSGNHQHESFLAGVPEHDQDLNTGSGPADSFVLPTASISCDVALESFFGGVMVRAAIRAPWQGICRRCAEVIKGELFFEVKERFCQPEGSYEDPDDDEAYRITDDELDLWPMIHDVVVLELPVAPLCRIDCKGLCASCGADLNASICACKDPIDSRWSSLDVLRQSTT